MLRRHLTVLVLLCGVLACAAEDPPALSELRVSAIPDADPTKLLATFEPLASYLSQAVGVKVVFTPVAKYELVVEALVAKRLELAWLGGYTSVQAVRQSQGNVTRIAMRAEDARFRSVFIAGTATSATQLADLKGRTFAFGANASTSGHLMPRHFLVQQGLVPEEFLGRIAYSGAHDKTAKLVESGAAEAGAMNALTWERMVKNAEVDATKVGVIWTTPEYVDYCWAARRDLPTGMLEKLRMALLALDPAVPEHQAMLAAHAASRYIEAGDAQWDGIAAAARAAGMLPE